MATAIGRRSIAAHSAPSDRAAVPPAGDPARRGGSLTPRCRYTSAATECGGIGHDAPGERVGGLAATAGGGGGRRREPGGFAPPGRRRRPALLSPSRRPALLAPPRRRGARASRAELPATLSPPHRRRAPTPTACATVSTTWPAACRTTVDLHETVDLLASGLRELADAVDCDIWMPEGDRLRCVVSCDVQGFDRAVVGKDPAARTLPAHAAHPRLGRPLAIDDLRDGAARAGRARRHARAGASRASSSIPMVSAGSLVGLIDLYDVVPRDFSRPERRPRAFERHPRRRLRQGRPSRPPRAEQQRAAPAEPPARFAGRRPDGR